MNPGHRHEPSSSFDSADAGSPLHGTPDTKSTALSPEEFRHGITNQGPATTNQPPAFLLGAVPLRSSKSATLTYHDPFVTSKLARPGGYSRDPSKTKLSPIAPAFNPLALGGASGENIVSSTLTVPVNSARGVTGTIYVDFKDVRDAIEVVRSLRGLGQDLVVEYLAVPGLSVNDDWNDRLAPKHEGQLLVKAEFSGPAVYFNTDTVGRLILDLLNNYGTVMAYETVSTIYPIVAYRAEFFDVENAGHAIVHLNGFRIAGCTMSVQAYRDEGPVIVGREEGFLDNKFREMGLENIAPNSAIPNSRSPLLSPHSVPSPTHNSISTPGFLHSPRSPMLLGSLSPGLLVQQFGEGSPISQSVQYYHSTQSPTWSNFDATLSNPGTIGQERRTPISPFHCSNPHPRNLMRHGGRHLPDHSGGHHNVVDINRIRKGADVRTTIMLRNIPNKIDQAMLKDIIDETSWGRYDFMYLRIVIRQLGTQDTKPDSVGYAFINFEDPYYIIEVKDPFVNARSGQRWNRFNSDKVAEVSYATIQGKDCLVQKFRNSSVMLEHPSFRPKIFRTGDDPMAGTEEPFPSPDNPSKMRRSVENAEHVGETSTWPFRPGRIEANA
ncbi:MAG: hypothetical protein Q9192_002742 [Flavoplaca navasiana]